MCSKALRLPAVLGALFVLAPGLLASERVIDEAKRARARALGELTKARDELGRVQKEFAQATDLASRKAKKLEIAINCMQICKDEWGSPHQALVAAQNEVNSAALEVKQIRDQLYVKRKALEELEAIRDRLLETRIPLYEMKWSVFIEYNATTGSCNSWAEMPQGLKITSSALSAAFSGGVPLPEFDLLEMLATGTGLRVDRECTFEDEVAKLYPAASADTRVYVSSRGLSELLTTEHAIDEVWKGILSGGSTLEGTADELANGCLRELNGVYAFLQGTVGKEAEEHLEEIMQTILAHRSWNTPHVQIRAIEGRMKYTVRLPEESRLEKLLPALRKKSGDAGKTLSLPRYGFVVFVKPTATAGYTKDLRLSPGKPRAAGEEVLKAALGDESYDMLEAAFYHKVDLSSVIAPGLDQLFRGVDYAHITGDVKDPFLFDLRTTSIRTKFESFAARLKIGNCGRADVRRLAFNPYTGQSLIEFDLLAKQETTLGEAIMIAKKSVEDVHDESIVKWKAAVLEVKKLHDRIPGATHKLAAASGKVGRLSELLKKDEANLAAVLAEQKTAQAAFDEATKAEKYSRGRRDAAANSVKRAEQNVKDFEKLIAELSHPLEAERLKRLRR